MKACSKNQILLVLVLGMCWGRNASSAPVIETFDRFELNWSTMKIRFYGESVADFTGKGFADAEKAAVEDGVLYALTSLGGLRSEKGLGQGYKNLPNDLTKQAYLHNTTYFADGRVRADMEANLVRAMDLGGQTYLADEPQAAPGDLTGIHINVKGLKGPRMLSGIFSNEGELLHDSSHVSKTSYRRNALGRWFYRNSSEVKAFSGPNIATIDGVYSGGRLLVSKADWETLKKNNPRVLEESKIAFLLYGSGKTAVKQTDRQQL